MDKVNMMKNKNRRGFFRIYEEVNLFYKKIDEKSLTESQPVFDKSSNTPPSPTDKLAPEPRTNSPDAQFNKNDVCNINISASGLAFNCEDALKEGDCLMIRIMPSSGSAAIEAQCKIVYCKNSPSNDNECPYFVGAHFINMKDKDRELLVKHVDKKRLQSRWVNAFILALVITVITLPDVVFGLLFELLHLLGELSLHALHLVFEFIESNLDHLVEHIFETDVHQTQVIVFYILVPFIFYGFYRLWRVVPPFYRWCKRKQIAYWSRKKANLLFYWREQSTFEKLKLVVIGATVITCYIFFGM
jgi:hypothetical protein